MVDVAGLVEVCIDLVPLLEDLVPEVEGPTEELVLVAAVALLVELVVLAILPVDWEPDIEELVTEVLLRVVPLAEEVAPLCVLEELETVEDCLVLVVELDKACSFWHDTPNRYNDRDICRKKMPVQVPDLA